MTTGIYKRTKYHGEMISKALRKIGHRPPHLIGKDASNWQGGRIKRSGYWYIYSPEHPYCGKQKYVAEHRLVMEKHLGRYLKRGEIVHHKDHNQENNSLDNLVLYSSAGQHTIKEHSDIFEKQRIAFKGKHFSRKTEFRKGNIPWNKS